MPAKHALAAPADDVKRAKSGSDRKPGERIMVPVRKPRPECEPREIIGKDEAYKLRVAGKVGGSSGTYKAGGVEFCAKRFSDYDTPLKNKDGKIIGRRPRSAKDFEKFEDIIKEYKSKPQKWTDKDAPQGKNGYKEEDMIKEPFVYRAPKEVWPSAKVMPWLKASTTDSFLLTRTDPTRKSSSSSPVRCNLHLIPAM
jgi:hypothetical protein